MNKIYRLLWNALTGLWVPVAEHARARGKRSRGGRSGVAPVLALLAGIAGLQNGRAQAPPAATALPSGGQVVAGQASLQQQGATLTVQQTSARAAIDWQRFDVGAQAQVNVVQPDARSVMLNRVADGQASQIFGRITANGQVFLSNPAGVYFAPSARVDVGALVATTHRIGLDDFMAGRVRFERAGASGTLLNEGQLRAALGGYIALLAPEVRNQGVLVAHMGTVALAAGEAFELQFDSNNTLASLRVEPSTIQALVDNQSAVLAPGGLVILSAQAMDRVRGGVVRNSGQVEANGLQRRGGRIVLEASDRIDNTGTLAANAGPDGPAGSVRLAAPQVINDGLIEARGSAGDAPAEPHAAAGGQVTLSAGQITQGAGGALDVSAALHGGSLRLEASGAVHLEGALRAQANAPVEAQGAALALPAATGPAATPDTQAPGGSIAVQAPQITLASAHVDASGTRGGQVHLDASLPAPHTPPAPFPAPLPAPEPGKLALTGATHISTRGRRGSGGEALLLGDAIDLQGLTHIDSGGSHGGGRVRVGGGWQGGEGLPQATRVDMGADVRIDASANVQGKGGSIVLWSDALREGTSTTVRGQLLADGGAGGGDGGEVETSGHTLHHEGAMVRAAASHGVGGLWLLDPADATVSQTIANAYVATLNTGTSVLNQVSGQITLSNNVILQKTAGGDATLTFKATGRVQFNQGVQIKSTFGKLNLVLWSDSDGANAGTILVGPQGGTAAVRINTNGGHIWMGGGSGSTAWNGLTVGTGYATGIANLGPWFGIEMYGDTIIDSMGGHIQLKGRSSAVNTSHTGSMGILMARSIVRSGNGNIDVQTFNDGNAAPNGDFNATGVTVVGDGGFVSTGGNISIQNTFTNTTTNATTRSAIGVALISDSTGSPLLSSNQGTVTVGNDFSATNAGIQYHFDLNHTNPAIEKSTTAASFIQPLPDLVAGATGSYVSSSPAAATVDAASGLVDLLGVGSSTVTATLTRSDWGSVPSRWAYRINTLAKAEPTLGFAQAAIGKQASDPVFTQTATGSSGIGSITYSSSNRSVATVNASTGAVTLVGPGSTSIIATSASNTTYVSASARYTLNVGDPSVTPTPVYVRLTDSSGSGYVSTYGQSPNYSYALFSTAAGGSPVSLATTGSPSWSNGVNSASGAGIYSITYASGLSSTNPFYALAPGNAITWTVQPAPLTVTANNLTRNFDGSTFSGGNGVSYSGFVNGDTAAVLGGSLSYGGTSQGAVNAGSYTIVPGGLTAANYSLGYVNGTLLINPVLLRAVTASLSGQASKVYDGNLTATLSPANYVLTGWAGSDGATVTQTTGTYADTQVGSGKLVNVSLSPADFQPLGGTDLGNYTLPTTVSGLIGHITPAPLTVAGLTAANRVYDGSSQATVHTGGVVFNGLVASDIGAVTLTAASGSFDSKHAGIGKTVTLNTTLGGPALGNYSVTHQASTTADITPAMLTLAGATTGVAKTYDGTPSLVPTGVSGHGGLVGVLGNDQVSLTGAAVFSSPDVARDGSGQVSTRAIAQGSLALTGADAGNYRLAWTDGSGTIHPAPLTVTGASASGTYTGLPQSVSGFSVSGLQGSDTVDSLIGIRASGATRTNAGTAINAVSADPQVNYAITTVDGLLTIDKAPATVTANSDTGRVYTGAPQSVTGFTATGLVNGETAAVLTGVTAGATGTAAGSYTSRASGSDANYALRFVDGSLVIAPAPLTITGASANATYTGLPQSVSGFSVSGLQGSDTVASLSGIRASGATRTNAGTAINAVSADPQANYAITTVDGLLTIDKAPATVTANSDTGRVYTGAPQSVSGFTATGLVNGETAAVLTGVTAGATGTAAGSYTSRASGSDANYALQFVDGSLVIAKAPLTVTPLAQTRVYGQDNPPFPQVLSGFVAGESAASAGITGTAFGSSSAGPRTAVGTVAIRGDTGSLAAPNYRFEATDGSLSITPAPLSVALVGDVAKVYDANTQATLTAANVQLAGWADGEGAAFTQALGRYADKQVGAGKTVSVDLAAAHFRAEAGTLLSNYRWPAQVSGPVGRITPATLTAVTGITAQDKVYDGNTAVLLDSRMAVFAGQMVGDALSVASASGQFSDRHVGVDKPVDITGLSLGGADAANYVLASPNSSASASIHRLDTVRWIGGPGGNWFDPGNWTGGAIPDRNNVREVQMPPGATVRFDTQTAAAPADTGPVQIDSLGSAGQLQQHNGSLVVGSGGIRLDVLNQTGGSTHSGGPVTLGSLLPSGGQLTHDGRLQVATPPAQQAPVLAPNPPAAALPNPWAAPLTLPPAAVAMPPAALAIAPAPSPVATGPSSIAPVASPVAPAATPMAPAAVATGGASLGADGQMAASASSNRAAGSTAGLATAPATPSSQAGTPPAVRVEWVAPAASPVASGTASSAAGDVNVSVRSDRLATGFSFGLPEAVNRSAPADAAARASLPDGQALPAWLRFDPASRSFTAQRVPPGGLPLVVAVDVGGQRSRVTITEEVAGRD